MLFDEVIPRLTGRSCGAFPGIGRTLPFRHSPRIKVIRWLLLSGNPTLARLPDLRRLLQIEVFVPVAALSRLAFVFGLTGFARRHFGPLITSVNGEIPVTEACSDRAVPPLLDPHAGAPQPEQTVLARNPIDLRLQRNRVIVVHAPALHMAENGGQIMMLFQRPVGVVRIGRRHRQRAH